MEAGLSSWCMQMGKHRRLRCSVAPARVVVLTLALLALAILAFACGCSPGRNQERPTGEPVMARAIPPTVPPAPSLTAPQSPTLLRLLPPSASPLQASTATPLPPTERPHSAVTPTASQTATPQAPHAVADGEVNLRDGPGRAYPVVATLHAGQEVEILGRNAAGDWWQLDWTGGGRVWVAATVVRVLGPTDTVVLIEDVLPPPPAPTVTPRPTAPAVTPGPEFKLVGVRLWDAVENGGSFEDSVFNCGMGRVLHVYVKDAEGNRLDGVTVKSATMPYEEDVTGRKGPGVAEFVLGEAKEVYVLRDAAGREVISDRSGTVSTLVYDIPVELLIQGGYCRDAEDCANFVAPCSCCHHYSWDVTFQRAN